MNLQEILKSQGLTTEQIQTITTEMKANKLFISNEENLDIRYNKLKTDHDNLVSQHKESTDLIEQLKSSVKGNDALQAKITGYETEISKLNNELKEAQLESAIKVALLEAKANDIDYMTFKLKEKGELELDDNGKIKGIDDKIAGLKSQYAAHFTAENVDKEIDVLRLNQTNDKSGMTKSEFLRKSYAERAAYAAENPEAYNALMGRE